MTDVYGLRYRHCEKRLYQKNLQYNARVQYDFPKPGIGTDVIKPF